MASFILRSIDPVLWARVEAKAAAEGITVKQLVLKALAQYVALLALLLLTTACGAASPTQATPLADPAPVPASITVTALAGQGNSVGQVFLSATVKDASGKGVGAAIVAFTSTAGTFTVTPITTGAGGLAQAQLSTTVKATVTATTGSVTQALDVVPTVAPAPVTADPPIFPPPVVTPRIPPVAPTITLDPITTTVGLATGFHASLSGDTAAAYAWTFGDGATSLIATPSHTYTAAGAFTATVTVITTHGALTLTTSAPVTVQAVVTAPPPVLRVSLTCTPAVHGLPSVCNVAATYGGVPLASNLITSVDWDWGDGTVQLGGTELGSHAYLQAGTYRIAIQVQALTVDGAKSATTALTLTVL